MSFTQFLYDDPQLTREQVMQTIIGVAHELRMPDERGAAIIGGMIVSQEVGVEDNDPPHARRFWCPANANDAESFGFQHDSVSNDGRSVGYLQQQKGPSGELWWGTTAQEMDLHAAMTSFLSRLKAAGYDASNAHAAASSGCAIQNPADHPAYIAEAAGWWDDINALYDTVTGAGPPPAPGASVPDAQQGALARLAAAAPDFHEYPVLVSRNFQDRNGTDVDLILGHTEESSGYDNADGLAHWLETTTGGDNPVSYNRTISKGQHDDGVTVCNVVPITKAAWAVGNSNNRSINMCFAGTSANWTRQEWIDNCGRCFDVFSYLAVRDAITLGWTSCPVIPGPNYNADPPGVSDHRYCSDYLQDGNNHTDMGDNVPWDLIETAVGKYWAAAYPPEEPPAPPVVVDPPAAADPTKDPQGEVLAQVRGRWERLGWQTPVEVLAELRDHLLGTSDKDKTGFRW